MQLPSQEGVCVGTSAALLTAAFQFKQHARQQAEEVTQCPDSGAGSWGQPLQQDGQRTCQGAKSSLLYWYTSYNIDEVPPAPTSGDSEVSKKSQGLAP